MARQTPVRSYNTVHNKIQNARSAFSSKFFVILAIAIAGTVVFFSSRFYLAEKNGTASGDTSIASESGATPDGTTNTPSADGSSQGNSSSGSNTNQGGSSASNGSKKSSGSESTSDGSAAGGESTNGCTNSTVPKEACTSMRDIESKGLTGNPLVAVSFPKIPETAAFIIDDNTWAQSSDSSATVKMAAFYDGKVDRTLLQMNLQGSNWVVTGFTQQ
ncbi:MAG: hypothetical protein NTX11_00660 [Candidatus Saccharibacteria bacterium]|nr:hypothetical protein [Candidatus Saccharibacteria bacterium]